MTKKINDNNLHTAIEFRDSGKYKEAQDWLYTFIKSHPNNPEAYSLLSQILLLDKKDHESEKYLLIAESLNSELPSIYLNYARLLLKQSKIKEALVKAKKGYDLLPDDPDSWLVLAACFGANNKDKDAHFLIEKVLKVNPKSAEALANRGILKLRKKESSDAIMDLERAVSYKHHLTNIWVLLSSLYYQDSNLPGAIEALRNALKNEPTNVSHMIKIAQYLKEDNKLDEAITFLQEAIKLDSKNAQINYNMGVIFHEMDRLDEARASYKRTIELNPDFIEAHYNLGIIMDRMNDLKSAVISFKKVLKLDFNDNGLKAGVNLAIYYFLQDDFSKSKKILFEVIEILEKKSSNFRNEKIYWKYLSKILNWHEKKYLNTHSDQSKNFLYIVGESHSLVGNRLNFKDLGFDVCCKSKLIKGCKQWHLGNSANNHYKNKFTSIFSSLPKSSNVLLTIGEIDCRIDSGIINYKNKYPDKDIKNIISKTIDNYLSYVLTINNIYQHNIFIQGVPCPNIDINIYSKNEVKLLIEVIKDFNFQLKNKSKKNGLKFLDIHYLTDRGDGFSNDIWHIDDYHLSPEGFLEAWKRYLYEYKNL